MTDRGSDGRFVKGKSGNVNGRPKGLLAEQYLAAMRAQLTLEDWQAIVQRAIADAKRGDAEARRWISSYILGMPVQKNELSGTDGGPIIINWGDNSNG